MNRELAIAILEDMIGDCKGNCLTKDKEALEYAVEVLKKDKEESIPIKEDALEVPVPEQTKEIVIPLKINADSFIHQIIKGINEQQRKEGSIHLTIY